MKRLTLITVMALIFALMPPPPLDRRALAESISCGINEITSTTAGTNDSPSINADGTRIAFSSDRDLTGGNGDGNLEIFLYDTNTNSFTQVTHTAGFAFGNLVPSINADGTRIAFRSDYNLTGGNGDGNSEIFLYDASANSFIQVTDTNPGANGFPSISAGGTRIAFPSNGDLTGGNADKNVEVFLYDAPTNTTTQVTYTTGGVIQDPVINGDGTRITFSSNNDVTGENGDGNLEVFLHDATTNSLTQLTKTTSGGSFETAINGDGTRIALLSSSDLTGGNGDGNREIFFYDATTNSFTQVTNTTGINQILRRSINGDGTRIAFDSACDIVPGGNSDLNLEEFLYDTTAHSFTQVTDTTGGNSYASSISGDGTRIAFQSTAFANLGNTDGSLEIFLAACLSPDAQIDSIITTVNNSGVPVGFKTSLRAKLQAAQDALQAGDVATACSKLQDFLNEVNAQRGKKIPVSLADFLTSSVTEIMHALGCT